MGRRYEDVMRELVDAVVGGEYAEGMALPREPELQSRFGASRGVVREALRGLEDRGLVTAGGARGRTVQQREHWDVRTPDVLLASILHGPDRDTLGHALDARATVEREAAARVAVSATPGDLGLLAGHVDAMAYALEAGAARRPDAGDPFVTADAWFHRTLGMLSGNPVLAKLTEPLHVLLAELRHTRAPERDGAVLVHHRRILEAISSRDGALAQEAVDGYAQQLARWLRARD
jgi:DNA-binding FadR family transcriptional regulator